jgi:hypothetical protein
MIASSFLVSFRAFSMTLSFVRLMRRLAAGSALALAVLAALLGAGPAQAQALHPLPPDFLATLKDIDTSSEEMAASVNAIKNADLTYSIFSQRRVTEAIAGMERQLPVLKAQTADLRREESLRLLLTARTTFSEVQRNVGSISDILHRVTVRSQAQADLLDKLLARLDGASSRLDAALKRFDGGALALAAQASAVPATAAAPVPASSAPGQAQAPGPAASTAAPPSLPPDFLATLKDIDTASDEMAVSVAAIKNADLTYSIFSRNRVAAAIARMEQQLPVLKTQAADLRRDQALGRLLTARTTFSEVQRNVGAISDILHDLTVRNQSQADELDRLLARLDGAIAHLDAALKRFDSGAMALLDQRAAARPKP